jgi:hypothetical protein
MRRAYGFRAFVWGGLIVLLCGSPANRDVDVRASLTGADAKAALARSDDAPVPRDTKARRAALDIKIALPDPNSVLSDPLAGRPLPDLDGKLNSPETSDECLMAEDCVNQYLWSVYERARKIDTSKVRERIKVTVKKNGKSRVVTRTVIKFVTEDFTWKDPEAAQKAGMSVAEYVIGGMDRSFRVRLYRLLRALDDVGLAPGMTSGFRDDYRQSIASGNKAASDSSYHGGTRRGGYGHGLAADLVSVKGETRAERLISSQILWKWIDAHGEEFGIGRPYLDKDPPHVAPIDGKEYADKRGLKPKRAGL